MSNIDLENEVKSNMQRYGEYYRVEMTDGFWCYGLTVSGLIETTKVYMILHNTTIKGSTNDKY